VCIALHGKQPRSYGALPATGDRTALLDSDPAQMNVPTLQPGRSVLNLLAPTPEGWKAELMLL